MQKERRLKNIDHFVQASNVLAQCYLVVEHDSTNVIA